MTRALAGVLLGACGAIVIACSASRQQPMPSTAPMPSSSAGVRNDPHSEIAALDHEIAGWRAQLGLPDPAPAPMVPTGDVGPMSTPMPASGDDPSCHPGKSETCSNACTLADSICNDARRICALAEQLPGDEGAEASCSRGHASCVAANARCCGCA